MPLFRIDAERPAIASATTYVNAETEKDALAQARKFFRSSKSDWKLSGYTGSLVDCSLTFKKGLFDAEL